MNREPSESVETLTEPELRRRLQGLNRLLDVARTLAAEIDLEKVLRTIIAQACRALDCDRASLYRYDPVTEELVTAVVTELEIGEIRSRLDRGITGYVASHRQVANIADPSQDARWNSAIDQATGYHTRNILAAPLISPHDGRLLGVLQVLNKCHGEFDAADEDLIIAFSQHAAVALDRARLVDALRRRQEVESSLSIAREVQQGFMPSQLPIIPGYEAATWWFPQQAVGGDYCDVIPMRDGRVALGIADVSGHGLGPSLIMASVRAALRALLLEHFTSEELLRLLSESLAPDFQYGMFITMVLAILDPATHRLEFANAGHGPALVFSAAREEFVTLQATGLPLGVTDRPEFPAGPPLTIEPGDLIVLATDGIVEAANDQDEHFGLNRLQEIVRRNCRDPVEQLVDAVGEEVSSYYVGSSPPDDLTILVVRRNA